MRKAWLVVLAVIFVAGAAVVAHRGGRLRTSSHAPRGNSQSDSQRAPSDSITSKTAVAVSSAGSSAAIEISKHGPGMRRQPPESLKLPVPRTFDLKHVDPANFAAALGNDPGRIFNYLRDEIAYEVYTGCLRGPRGTLLAMAGNSVDRASLLASMLQHAGQGVRFAQGMLPEAQARELVSSMWAQRSQPAPVQAGSQPSPAVKAAVDGLVSGVNRDYPLIRDRLRQENATITSQSAPTLDSLVKEAQDHYWVQWLKGGTWVDLDPSFTDSSQGIRYATIAGTSEALPNALFHQVEIRIRLEEYTGDQVSSRVILTRTAKAAELSGVDVVLSHQPENWTGPAASLQAALASAITATGRVKPVLLVGEKDWVAGAPFYPKKPATRGMGGVFNALSGRGTRHDVPIATAESIELDFTSPGGTKETVVREIFDVAGRSVRAAGKNLTAQEVGERTDAGADLERGIYCLFFTTGRLDADHISNAVEDPAKEDQRETDVGMLLRRFNILFTVVSDAVVGGFAQPEQNRVLFYQDSARLSITEISGEPKSPRLALDLRRDHTRTVALAERSEMVVPARILRGVTDGTLEAVIMDYVRAHMQEKETGERFSLSTSVLFGRAQREGIPTIMLPKENGRLDTGLAADTLARIREEFSAGNVVLAPQRPISIGESKRFGWWRVNPCTGESVAVTDEGLNQVTVEYNMVQNKYGQGNIMLYREVGTDAAGNPFTGPTRVANPNWLKGYNPQWARIWTDFTEVMQGAVRNPALQLR